MNLIAELVVLVATIQDPTRFVINRDRVERAAAKAIPWVEAECGVELAGLVEIRTGNAIAVAEALEKQGFELMRSMYRSEEKVRRLARIDAAASCGGTLAVYTRGPPTILVCPDSFKRTALALGEPDVVSEAALLAVLVHELVHAADDRAFGLFERYAALVDTGQSLAYRAVSEGHAEAVAWKICEREGLARGFELVDAPNLFAGSDLGADEETAAAAADRSALLSSEEVRVYVDGRRFIEAIERRGGREAVARALLEPPDRWDVILNPEWFLVPDSMPRSSRDLAAIGDLVAEEWPERDYDRLATWVAAEDLADLLPCRSADGDPELASRVREARAFTLVPVESDDDFGDELSILAFEDEATAAAAVELAWKELVIDLDPDEIAAAAPPPPRATSDGRARGFLGLARDPDWSEAPTIHGAASFSRFLFRFRAADEPATRARADRAMRAFLAAISEGAVREQVAGELVDFRLLPAADRADESSGRDD